ncbi:hypothetical protein BU14_0207s0012 [Porphyra umbilicalis]|uniref:Uncharacterized protein n=1 Tax=Porphyra umbilicalis TaxID=2786 RepID=A0A1X6P645_PORUM|nr:hypothetical protein BU14_0207s0012 [Porphyra umbilicalis]|eukprot:OSX76093.1 hypothetical protein BU14_0207s0012 [Porphyra umbilicalis]
MSRGCLAGVMSCVRVIKRLDASCFFVVTSKSIQCVFVIRDSYFS